MARTSSCPGRPSPLHGGVDRNDPNEFAARQSSSRPFTGAWMETSGATHSPISCAAPSRGRGSKRARSPRTGARRSPPLHGGVDRNAAPAGMDIKNRASPLHGGVDRNLRERRSWQAAENVAPSRGRGSKPRRTRTNRYCRTSPLHGGVDRNVSASPSCCEPHDHRPFGRLSFAGIAAVQA